MKSNKKLHKINRYGAKCQLPVGQRMYNTCELVVFLFVLIYKKMLVFL